MNAIQTEQNFRAALSKLHALRHALAILNYDAETVMPPAGANQMGETAGLLAEDQHRLLISPELTELLEEVYAHRDQLPQELVAEARALTRKRDKMRKIPPEEFRAYSTIQAQALSAWKQAKLDNAFTGFRPYLERLVCDVRRFATYYNSKRPAYDVLLEDNDEGVSMDTLDPFFYQMERDLTPCIQEIASFPPVEDGFLRQPFSPTGATPFSHATPGDFESTQAPVHAGGKRASFYRRNQQPRCADHHPLCAKRSNQ